MKFSHFFLAWTCLAMPLCGHAQTPASAATPTTKWNPWQTEQSGTKADLRGIHAVGDGVAWASGAKGTVLRTEDSGFVWQQCKMPDDAEALDFRSVWAWDANTAIAMSSGPGAESRLYKTTDGCVHWRLLHTNPVPTGFWDGLIFADKNNGYLLGDPVKDHFVLLRTWDGGERWASLRTRDLGTGGANLGAFAASNSALALAMEAPTEPAPAAGKPSPAAKTSSRAAPAAPLPAPPPPVPPVPVPWFGTSGVSGGAGPYVYRGEVECPAAVAQKSPEACLDRTWKFIRDTAPLTGGNTTAGIFSLAVRQDANGTHAVAVGGDYAKANTASGTAAYFDAASGKWMASTSPPHGYRSAVAWDAGDSAWICVGPNGSDVSYDEGQTWQNLGDQGWNAISFPWVVGPEGRIGKLQALKGK
jgi:hypothetical protein